VCASRNFKTDKKKNKITFSGDKHIHQPTYLYKSSLFKMVNIASMQQVIGAVTDTNVKQQ
jgi:hypothetical protein